jgi:hypothetical protein
MLLQILIRPHADLGRLNETDANALAAQLVLHCLLGRKSCQDVNRRRTYRLQCIEYGLW